MHFAKGGTQTGSKQGEHVFNALDALAAEFAVSLRGSINPAAGEVLVGAAEAALDELSQVAEEFARARNNHDFSTANKGDPTNAGQYSNFVSEMRRVLRSICRNASTVTLAYTTMNGFLNNLDRYTIDQTARQAVRAGLNGVRQTAFDEWFNDTSELLYKTQKLLREAALAVARTHSV